MLSKDSAGVVRLIFLSIYLSREEVDVLSKDSAGVVRLRKEVLRLERDLMQQKSKNKVNTITKYVFCTFDIGENCFQFLIV